MVLIQLPFKTSEANAGGIPISDAEVDQYCRPHVGNGVINLSDGAEAYEAFAAGDITCSPGCQNVACISRARALGRDECVGSRPRRGRDRYRRYYRNLNLSHGVVSHNKAEWAIVKEVQVFSSTGRPRTVSIKHGTEVADGAWGSVKRSFPFGVKSSDKERIAEYIHAWAWRARRYGKDPFKELPRGFLTQ